MLSNALRSVCRLRNAAAFDASYASLGTLGRIPHSSSNQLSSVDHSLIKPLASVDDCYSPAYSVRFGSPVSSLSSPSDIASNWSLEDEKLFDNKYGIYELDALLCDEFDVHFEEAESCSNHEPAAAADEKPRAQQLQQLPQVDTAAAFQAFIDDLIASVKEEIAREKALEESLALSRAAAAPTAAAAAAAAPTDSSRPSSSARKRLLSDGSMEPTPMLRKRKRTFTLEEMALRKRNQNRRAAQRYREKLVKVKGEQVEECGELEAKNDVLRASIRELEEEIGRFKQLLLAKAEEAKSAQI